MAILASGAGSNARNIIDQFRNSEVVEVVLVASNKADAGVLKIAHENHIASYIITKENFREGDMFSDVLNSHGVNFIVLAGFLWKVPAHLIRAFDKRIINIHPALLPKFGGKGMYGNHVHEAIHAAREIETGITIHYVNENYDEGDIIFQARIPVMKTDSPKDIEMKVRALEMKHFPKAIEDLLTNK